VFGPTRRSREPPKDQALATNPTRAAPLFALCLRHLRDTLSKIRLAHSRSERASAYRQLPAWVDRTPRVHLRQKNTRFTKIEDLREAGTSMSVPACYPAMGKSGVSEICIQISDERTPAAADSTCTDKRALTRIWTIRHATESFLPFAQYGRRIKPCGTPRRQPGSQHTRGNQHTSRARERRRIAGLHLKQ